MGQGQVPGGSTPAQMRPILSAVEGVVAVDDTETQLYAGGNGSLRNLVVQNNGPDVVQVYLTTGLGFGGGGIQLAPGSATTVGGVWEALQDSGVWQGEVFAICSGGNSASVSVTQEF